MKKIINERTFIIWEILWLITLFVSLKVDDSVGPVLTIISILILFITPFVVAYVIKDEEQINKNDLIKEKETKREENNEKIEKKEIDINDIEYIRERKCSFKLPSIKTIINDEDYYNMLNNEFMKSLTIPIGIDDNNNYIYQNYMDNPNTLIGGVSKSGKTTYMKSIINSLLFFNKPSDLNFIIIDLGNEDYNIYKKIPHLHCDIIKNEDIATITLEGILEEINNRINILNATGDKNVFDYNKNHSEKKMQKILIIVDELALDKDSKFNQGIANISKIGYKVGVYTLMSLSEDINIDIKDLGYSFAYRISFKLDSSDDSLNVLNEKGAEDVEGIGNAVLQTSYNEVLTNIKVINANNKELNKIADIWTKKKERTENK